jgi:hexosaminidase
MEARNSIVLLPIPRRMELRQGCFALQSGDCISLRFDDKDLILPIAQRVQQELCDLAEVRLSIVIGGRAASRVAITFEHDAAIADEGYALSISEQAVSIRYSKPAGAFYATRTLKQVVRQCGRALPAMQVDDEPDFPSRGFMVDIGRDKIPTMATLYRIVDLMADVKLNHLELYIEGSPFAYASYPFMWESETPITGEEIMELDRYCRDRFVDLVPNQNSFGHMAPWLADHRLNHLAECPDGFQFNWGPMPPTTLDPNDPGSIDFIKQLYDDLLPYFSSSLFNVGCDETWELGKGKSKEACEEKGTGRVYLDYLLKIHDLVSERGKRMMFWGDIIGHYPELVPELPKDIIALEWGYEGEHPFEANCKRFRDSGIPFYVCPGTSSWNSIAGRTDNMIANLLNAARGGLATGAIGFLNTDWGDNGHWQYLPVSYAGLAYGAAVSWACEQNQEVDLASFLDKHVFLDRRQVMGKFALDLGNYYLLQGKKTGNSTVIFGILNSNLDDVRQVNGVTRDALLKTRSYVEGLEARLAKAEMKCDDADLVEAEFRNAIRFIKHGVDLGLVKLDIADAAHVAAGDQSEPCSGKAELKTRLQRMQDDIGSLIKNHRLLWLQRNRVGGLDRSTRRLEELRRQYKEKHFPATK